MIPSLISAFVRPGTLVSKSLKRGHLFADFEMGRGCTVTSGQLPACSKIFHTWSVIHFVGLPHTFFFTATVPLWVHRLLLLSCAQGDMDLHALLKAIGSGAPTNGDPNCVTLNS